MPLTKEQLAAFVAAQKKKGEKDAPKEAEAELEKGPVLPSIGVLGGSTSNSISLDDDDWLHADRSEDAEDAEEGDVEEDADAE